MSTFFSTATHDAPNLARTVPPVRHRHIEQSLELLLGPRDTGSAFASDRTRRASWRAHRAQLMKLVEPGSRPWAWWQYEAPQPLMAREPAMAYLERCGLLTEAERAMVAGTANQRTSHATRKP